MIVPLIAFLGMSFSSKAQEETNEEVAIDGYCPVAYKKMDKAVEGKSEYAATHDGETYYFVKDKARKMFEKKPGKFLPEYDGYCATAMAKGKKVEAKGELFSKYEGETYLFSNEKAKKMFDENPEKFVKKADKKFAALKN